MRELQALLPTIRDEVIHADFAATLKSHEYNIELVAAKLPTTTPEERRVSDDVNLARAISGLPGRISSSSRLRPSSGLWTRPVGEFVPAENIEIVSAKRPRRTPNRASADP